MFVCGGGNQIMQYPILYLCKLTVNIKGYCVRCVCVCVCLSVFERAYVCALGKRMRVCASACMWVSLFG